MYAKACGLKDGDGCLRLGEMQRSGEGVVKNREQAMKNFKKGCKLGSEATCWMLATEGLRKRCKLGDEKACGMSYDKQKALGF
ncbi:beta-lactamase hcpB [Helicobacter pylori NQ4099]|uniref:beta-lactamase n=1 Tax=Helicobacter pylori NQ4099 TaxID=992026 RepID=I9QB17_HELPX|nr:beta-lactamase hcpB [Helicobacter pylori NQ4099]